MGSHHSRGLPLCGDNNDTRGTRAELAGDQGRDKSHHAGIQGAAGIHKSRNQTPEQALQQWHALVQELCRRISASEIIRSSITNRNVTYRVSGILNLKQLHAHPQVHSFSLRAGAKGELIVQVVFLPTNMASEGVKRIRATQNRWANRCKTLNAALGVIQKEQLNGRAAWSSDTNTLRRVKVLTREHAVVLLHHVKTARVQGLYDQSENFTSMELLLQFE